MLVALTGRKQSGKDYLAEYLIKEHGFIRLSFSDQLKIIADKVFPWSAPNLEVKPQDKEKVIRHPMNLNGLTYRQLWKNLDTLRQSDPAVFVHGVRVLADEINRYGKNVLITDIRTNIEFKYCIKAGFQTIKINNMVDPTDDEFEDIIDTFATHHEFEHHKDGHGRFIEFCADKLGLDHYE